MAWHGRVAQVLRESGLFTVVTLVGAKVRACIRDTVFLDIHHDPTTGSYSYALIDLALPYAGDKRVLGWDDCPHEKVEAIRRLRSYPHHFQRRDERGQWVFNESGMRGQVEQEMGLVVDVIRMYLGEAHAGRS